MGERGLLERRWPSQKSALLSGARALKTELCGSQADSCRRSLTPQYTGVLVTTMADESPPKQRRPRQFVDKSKAAKLYIDNYYQNLLAKRQEREDRYGTGFFLVTSHFFL